MQVACSGYLIGRISGHARANILATVFAMNNNTAIQPTGGTKHTVNKRS